MLLVRDSGSRSWVFRYQLGGRRRDMGLGPYPEISLAEARDRALQARRVIKRDGKDPIAERRRGKAKTFKETAEALIESKRPGWRNAKHAAQWGSTLETYAYPKLGDLGVQIVDTDAVLDVLRPIWTSKTETASRVRQRIEAVLDYATAIRARTGENPARWKGHLDHLLPKPSQVRAVKHHAALDWRQAPALTTAALALANEAELKAENRRKAVHMLYRSDCVLKLGSILVTNTSVFEPLKVCNSPEATSMSWQSHRDCSVQLPPPSLSQSRRSARTRRTWRSETPRSRAIARVDFLGGGSLSSNDLALVARSRADGPA